MKHKNLARKYSTELFFNYNSLILGITYVCTSLVILQFRGRFRYGGVIAGDAPSYYFFDFSWPNGLLGSFRTFIYPLFIELLKQTYFPFEMLPVLQTSMYLIVIWLIFIEIKKRIPYLILIPFLFAASQGPHIGYFGDIQNEAISLVFWLLGLYLLLRSRRLIKGNILAVLAGVFFSLSILERVAFLGPTLVVIVGYFLFRSKSSMSTILQKKGLIVVSTITIIISAFILVKFITINKPSLSNYSGGLLVGHAALMESKTDFQKIHLKNSEGKLWVDEARKYLDQPCKDLRHYDLSLHNIKNSYLLENQCFLPMMMGTWTVAIHDRTGQWPLDNNEPIEKQIQSWKYSWPNNQVISLSRYHSENWDLYIDKALMTYSLEVLIQNWQQYLGWLASGTIYDFIYYLNWPEIITKHFSISFIESIFFTIIWSVICTYALHKRNKLSDTKKIDKGRKIAYLVFPLIFMLSIYASILPALYSVARYVVIWFPILFLIVPISTYYISKDLIYSQKIKADKKI